MRKLSTIQKRENLNEIFTNDEQGPGGAHHRYLIAKAGKLTFDDRYITADPKDILEEIVFQRGPRRDPDAQSGVLDADLLEIVRDRLRGFQAGELPSEYTAEALAHVEMALMWMNRRVKDRIERAVLGTMDK